MERIDKKIAENHQRQDFLRKRIQSDKEELAKLESEARVLEHSQLAVVFSCEIKDVNSLVTKEHDTLMRLRSQALRTICLKHLQTAKYLSIQIPRRIQMKARFFSAMLAAFMLATASVGGITASAAEKATAAEDTAETTAVDEDSSADTTETTADTEENFDTEETSSISDDKSDDMEKFREVMSDLAENGTTEVAPDYYGDDYYDTDGNATLIKSERIVYNSEEMQFIAVTTKDGHVFYVPINYSAENAEDQVFFLNKVDDYDLYALLYAGAEDDDEKKKITPEQAAQAAEKANGRVQSGDGADTADTEETAEDGEDATDFAAQAKPVPMNKNSMMLVFGAIALIGIGGAGFFIMKKKNGGNSKSAMQVEPEYDDDNEITEDDEDEMNFYDNMEDDE